MWKRSPPVVGRTVPGAPPSVDGLRWFRAPTYRHARPARVDWQRYCAPHTLHQPLSHGAERRDSSPFRGAEGWDETCGACASVYHDADTSVSLPPVRGGVLDAPRSRDCRGRFVADVWRDQLHPRHPRCARLASTSPRIISRGHSPRTIWAGVPRRPSSHAGRAWKPAPTVG